MPRFQYVVLTEAVPGREAECEAWYENQHVHDVGRVPGIVSARRFTVDKTLSAPGAPRWANLALYEIEADDPYAVLAEIKARAGTPDMPMCDAFLRDNILQVIAR